ncbi:MAG TPA: flagellin [Candidatus Baltobacteraceae bacterium]|nr:flagellin [Candidatus Baltobacteraceae bacterium]
MPFGDVNRINSNLGALNALNALADVNRQLQVSQLRLATGKRINEASDDPAGYSIANTLAYKTRGLTVALGGLQTVENLLGVAEGGLGNINDILLTMRDLVVQGASDTLGTTERTAINTQLDSLRAEIDRIAANTSFNGTPLLDGTFGSSGFIPGPLPPTHDGPVGPPVGPPDPVTEARFQTGDTTDDYISFSIDNDFSSSSLGVDTVSVDDSTTASNSLADVDGAISVVIGQVQDIGSMVQRIRLIENNLSVAITNTTAAKSRIQDVDIAQEQATSTRLQILRQLATAQLAQANLSPARVLSLFGIKTDSSEGSVAISARA